MNYRKVMTTCKLNENNVTYWPNMRSGLIRGVTSLEGAKVVVF